MLKSIIEQMHHHLLRRLVLLRHHTGEIPIRTLVDRRPRSLRQQHRLVAMPRRVVKRFHPLVTLEVRPYPRVRMRTA